MDIQNVLIKNCKGPSSISLLQDFTLFLVQNSLVKMRDVEVRQNSIETFIFAEKKITYVYTKFTKAIYNVAYMLITDNSYFWQNNMAIFLDMASKSSAIIQNNTLTENNVVLDVYPLNMMSAIQLNDVALVIM